MIFGFYQLNFVPLLNFCNIYPVLLVRILLAETRRTLHQQFSWCPHAYRSAHSRSFRRVVLVNHASAGFVPSSSRFRGSRRRPSTRSPFCRANDRFQGWARAPSTPARDDAASRRRCAWVRSLAYLPLKSCRDALHEDATKHNGHAHELCAPKTVASPAIRDAPG